MIVWMVCAGSAGAPIAVHSIRRLKTMSEKPGKLSAGRAGVLAVVAAGALVAACDVPLPTEPGEAIGEVSAVEARESRDGSPARATANSNVAKWFASEPAPLVFVDGVRVASYEDLPEPVRRWSESGLREDGLIARVEVLHGAAARAVWREEGAGGAIRIFTSNGPLDESIVEPPGFGPGEPLEGLWEERFPGMSKAYVVVIDGVVGRDDDPEHARRIAELDPGDIDRLEMFKGPWAALRLYGHDARGVAVIFTKKGSRQRTADRAWKT